MHSEWRIAGYDFVGIGVLPRDVETNRSAVLGLCGDNQSWRMKFFGATVQRRCSPLWLVAGWCALLLYGGASLPLGIELAAALGVLDRSHHVIVKAQAGGLQVVLHHERRGIAHRHGPVARVLTLFAEPTRANQPDHVLQFGAPDCFARQTQLAAQSLGSSKLLAVIAPTGVLRLGDVCPRFSASTRPPVDFGGPPLHLRSTVLLI